MKIQKRLAALVLTIIFVLTLGAQAFAATSPTHGPSGYQDDNVVDHQDKMVVSIFNKNQTRGRVIEVKAEEGKDTAYSVQFSVARDQNNQKVPIQFIGDGKKGVFNNSKGHSVTHVVFKSKVVVRVLKRAFKNSNVNTVRIQSATTFYENAFIATRQKSVTFRIDGKGKKLASSDIVFKASSMTGLNTKTSKVIVYGSRMKETEFNKLKKKLVRQGFKGSITYYSNR